MSETRCHCSRDAIAAVRRCLSCAVEHAKQTLRVADILVIRGIKIENIRHVNTDGLDPVLVRLAVGAPL